MKTIKLTKCPISETLEKLRPVRLHPKARDILSSFPIEVKRVLGSAIFDLQKGAKLKMPLSRPITSVGSGVAALRIRDRFGVYRVFYFARLTDSILVFHAFQKKTEKTPNDEIRLGQKRLKEMLDEKD